MMMSEIPKLAENIRRLVHSLAVEIATRVVNSGTPDTMRAIVERHAELVLYDWFLGDFIPDYAMDPQLPTVDVPAQIDEKPESESTA